MIKIIIINCLISFVPLIVVIIGLALMPYFGLFPDPWFIILFPLSVGIALTLMGLRDDYLDYNRTKELNFD